MERPSSARPVVAIAAIVAALLFGIFVWPSRYTVVASPLAAYRVDRFTGETRKISEEGSKPPEPKPSAHQDLLKPKTLVRMGQPFNTAFGKAVYRLAYLNDRAILESVIGPIPKKHRDKMIAALKVPVFIRLCTEEEFAIAAQSADSSKPFIEWQGDACVLKQTLEFPMSEATFHQITKYEIVQ